jgi:hypothetical protein
LISPRGGPLPPAGPLAPGTTLAGRYRIVSQLGKGGMGAVYRADDLELGVSVAVKLLPPQLAADPIQLDRFRAEVRHARAISHPNIVRVFDIAAAEGLTFLTMEYVDGEDLASLLRRIGRLPQDKAVQIARQLCFGLAAAHESGDQGVIHRDLKPANIMIDGRGNARIMDFGVAGLAAQLMAAGDITSGTPAYMAPEQLAGREVSKRSDLYSLGLVLYELFTGRPAFSAQSLAEIRRVHESSTRPQSLSSIVADLDPAVERVIFRCLEPDPADRPPSALAVAAALPGGDPLAAAMAAGETPSPELIAASGASQAISPKLAWGTAAIVALLIAAAVVITSPLTIIGTIKPEKPRDALQDRAMEVLRLLGYTDPPADSSRGMSVRAAFQSQVNANPMIEDKAAFMRGRPGVYEFWYRQSPALLTPDDSGPVRTFLPFPAREGEIVVRTDSGGRLEFFFAQPVRTIGGRPPPVPEATLDKLLEFAGIDRAALTEAEPNLRPFMNTDLLKSWSGTVPGRPEYPMRVHYAEAAGRVVYFSVIYTFPPPPPNPTEREAAAASRAPEPPKRDPAAPARVQRTLETGLSVVIAAIIAGTCLLVWRNIRAGRSDRVGAFRIGVAVFLLASVAAALAQHRFPSLRSLLFQGEGFGEPAFVALEYWCFYIALEPYARRIYPHALVSWSRLLRGAVHDPLVGRHMLIGLALGGICILFTAITVMMMRLLIWKAPLVTMYGRTGAYLSEPSMVASSVGSTFVSAFMLGAGTMLTLVIGQLLFKRRAGGYAAVVLVLAAASGGQLIIQNPFEAVSGILVAMIPILAIRPGGLLALVTTHATLMLGQMLHVGLDWSHWFTAPALIPAGVLAGMLVFAARTASAGRSFVP